MSSPDSIKTNTPPVAETADEIENTLNGILESIEETKNELREEEKLLAILSHKEGGDDQISDNERQLLLDTRERIRTLRELLSKLEDIYAQSKNIAKEIRKTGQDIQESLLKTTGTMH